TRRVHHIQLIRFGESDRETLADVHEESVWKLSPDHGSADPRGRGQVRAQTLKVGRDQIASNRRSEHFADFALGEEVISFDLDTGDPKASGNRESFGEEKSAHHESAQSGTDLQGDEDALPARPLVSLGSRETSRP